MRLHVLLAIGLIALTLGACAKKSSDSTTTPTSSSITYTMTALASEFAIGRYVVVADQAMTGDPTCNVATAPVTRSEFLVTSAGNAAVHITLPLASYVNYYIETIYVDVNANHLLDNGDLVMGTSSTTFGAFCNLMGTDNKSFTFNWDALMASAFSGGPTAWTNGTLTFNAGLPAGGVQAASAANLQAVEGVVPSESVQ